MESHISQMNKITVEEAQAVVKTKRDFHEALDRHGYMIPPYKSGAATIGYLKMVRAGKVYCPKYVDVKVRSCYCPPKKELIFIEIMKELVRQRLPSLGFDDE